MPDSVIADTKLHALADALVDDLESNAEVRVRRRADGSDRREVNYFVGKSKKLIDEIDRTLARHYGFTDEWYMRQFFLKYHGDVKLQPLVGEISWAKNLVIMGHCKDPLEREFYIIKYRIGITGTMYKRGRLERELETNTSL